MITKLVAVETGHEVLSCDDVDRRLQNLQNQLETPGSFLFADPTDCTNFLEGSGHTFLSAGNVQTCCCNGVRTSSFQILTSTSALLGFVKSGM